MMDILMANPFLVRRSMGNTWLYQSFLGVYSESEPPQLLPLPAVQP